MASEWTVDTLKEYVDALLEEREKRRDEQHQGVLLAVQKADAALEHRLDLLNEFRQQATDSQSRFVTKEEFDALEKRYDLNHSRIEIDVSLLKARVVPMIWVGSTLVVASVGLFVSHIATGKP